MKKEIKDWKNDLFDKLIYIHNVGYNCHDWETYDMMKSFITELLNNEKHPPKIKR